MATQQHNLHDILAHLSATNILTIKAADCEGRTRTITMLMNATDNWQEGMINVENQMARLNKICADDITVAAYQGAVYSQQPNGLYVQTRIYYPEIKNEDIRRHVYANVEHE